MRSSSSENKQPLLGLSLQASHISHFRGKESLIFREAMKRLPDKEAVSQMVRVMLKSHERAMRFEELLQKLKKAN
jgi:hypothetical protein